MMRPVILSRPEKVAFLLVTFVDGGSLTTSSPGWMLAGVCGTPLGWRCPGGKPGNGLAPGGVLATPGCGAAPGCGGCTAMPGCCPCGTTVVPGGGARGCDCTAPGGGTPCPGACGRLGNRRPRGNSGTCSSSSGTCCCCCCPRGIEPGGRSGGSEKMLPICACAGGATAIVDAAIRAAKPERAKVRNISRLQRGESGDSVALSAARAAFG